jgi:hypothetical protein
MKPRRLSRNPVQRRRQIDEIRARFEALHTGPRPVFPLIDRDTRWLALATLIMALITAAVYFYGP